ncbi:substrate-binding domain-containing protein, partial [Mycobacterium sp. 94-17]|uniref:substrate-binding domain-containing protein n=1 Tax=Mycobacterium sp. 94-17 TaxID=2986147 RepID=UPI002D1F1A62
MKDRFAKFLAVAATAPLVLAAAGCGSGSTNGSSSPGAGGPVATTPATSPVTLSETGSTLLYPLFNLWAPAYHDKYSNVTITPQGTGSGTGISQAAAGAVSIGASDAYLSEGDMA